MQIFPLKLIPDETKIDFISFKNLSYTFSIILVLSVILLCGVGKTLNYGIDFAGGINIDAETEVKPNITKLREILSRMAIGDVSIQSFGRGNEFSIKIPSGNVDELNLVVSRIKRNLLNNYGESIKYKKIDYVGPQVGKQLIQDGFKAVLFSFLAIMSYVWFRFEWQFGLGVLISLIHDVIIAIGFMIYTQLDFNLSSVAAILTIVGYSVNDSVVIYDRIRENLRKYRNKDSTYIINLSINETLSRTILTVLTTLLAGLSLILFGGETLYSFSMLVFVGIIIGTYSSILISAPILFTLNLARCR